MGDILKKQLQTDPDWVAPIAGQVHLYYDNTLGAFIVVDGDGGPDTPVGSGGGEQANVQTVGTTPQDLFTFDADTNDRVYSLRGTINVLEESTGLSNVYEVLAQWYRDNVGVVSVKHGPTLIANDEDMPTASIQATLTGTTCRLQVTGVTAKTLEWDGIFVEQHRA
jgi:hypothetical protein